jgi:hypothetical protein
MGSKRTERECPVCLGAHDDQIHAATVSLHAWWRKSLLSRLDEPLPEADPWGGPPTLPLQESRAS